MARGKRRKAPKLEELPGLEDPAAPIDGAQLLAAARPVLDRLREDLGARADASPAVTAALEARHAAEKEQGRTADGYSAWRDGLVAQVAASWFLSCVFVRTLEDRGLLGQARLAGQGAADSQRQFLQLAPSLTERDYLLLVFRELAGLPAAGDLFDREHALVHLLAPSAEAAKELLRLFRTPSAETPAFRFGQVSTRFLGDLYQDLYEDVRKRYALLQTPDFVESFILDRTLEPAIERFGLDETTLIDPTCGSGHFLLGAFERLFQHRLRAEPGLDVAQAALRALDAVYGADINPYATAIARFRLTLAYLEKAQTHRLADAPALPLHLVVADSLLHNPTVQGDFEYLAGQQSANWRNQTFALEDDAAAQDLLHRRYAAVVGNPPYITPKDKVLRKRYAQAYSSCRMNYALSVPFCERFFQLAREGGQVGQITANSFMKREFGKKLIEEFLSAINLQLIVNTSGAYIPGHGTPTVLLFGAHEPPRMQAVRAVLAKRGEPSTPAEPANGQVWSTIANHWADVGFENDYVSVGNVDRGTLGIHPWSLAGGGASELKDLLELRAGHRLRDVVDDVGFSIILGEDDVFKRPAGRAQWENSPTVPMVLGEEIRDWSLSTSEVILRPFDWETLEVQADATLLKELWPWRTVLKARIVSGSTSMEDAKREWFDVRRLSRDKHRTPLSIAFAEVATHNHFVLDRGGKVFKQTAPIIKLPESATEDDHLALLAYLNSSTACFWMKQVCFPKGTTTGDISTEKGREEANRYAFSGGAISPLPFPPWSSSQRSLLVELAREASAAADERELLSASWLVEQVASGKQADRTALESRLGSLEWRLLVLQEDIDWLVYQCFGLFDGFEPTTSSPSCSRPFEAMREQERQVAASEWGSRLIRLRSSAELQVLEAAVFKRLWSGRRGVFGHAAKTFDEEVSNAVSSWLQDQVEQQLAGGSVSCSIRELLDHATASPSAAAVLRLIGAESSNEAARAALGALEAVPFLAAQRFTAAGIKKHAAWRRVWEAQRQEDSGIAGGRLAVPPKYATKDFTDQLYWRLRGKLDVPKERFISYPGCESDEDGEPVYGWAGWNHLQRAQALASLYQARKTDEGWQADRLTPMLAGLLELIPWVKQWHNEPDAEFGGLRMGDYFEQFVDGECALWGLTREDLESWRPPKKSRKRRAAAKTKKPRAKRAKANDGGAQSNPASE